MVAENGKFPTSSQTEECGAEPTTTVPLSKSRIESETDYSVIGAIETGGG